MSIARVCSSYTHIHTPLPFLIFCVPFHTNSSTHSRKTIDVNVFFCFLKMFRGCCNSTHLEYWLYEKNIQQKNNSRELKQTQKQHIREACLLAFEMDFDFFCNLLLFCCFYSLFAKCTIRHVYDRQSVTHFATFFSLSIWQRERCIVINYGSSGQ